MTGTINFFVPGEPVPEGSTKYVGHAAGRPILVHTDPDLPQWRQTIGNVAALYARQAGWILPLEEPISIRAVFFMPKPPRTKFKDSPARKPDLDKLIRAVGDALAPKGGRGVIREDGRIIRWLAEKRWADEKHPAGVDLAIVRQEVPF
ncbi:hypothetical protein HMPREF9241_01682 [Schaalia turicensis ACS-279-V-Col4]|uniref:Uncharacterized protein n=1 Tax=Schaalia turicensis ACS-279-V-Col4 TaxID=883077 RepID=K0YN57_9ACTO|nr:hypothetical protein HMPREF9241_01682 [Schaalia turicensis ACS-279-V-Col4]